VTAAEMAAADLATKDWLFHTSASGTQLGMQLIILYRQFFSDLALLIFMFWGKMNLKNFVSYLFGSHT
jgi:hypothetical protein